MADMKDFFSSKNTIRKVTKDEKTQITDYMDVVLAFAKTTYNSIYIIDYEKKGFDYVSDNPLFLCGHTADKVKELGYEFYFQHVIPQDLDLLIKINTIGFDFYEQIPVNERKEHTISYDFHIKSQEGKAILINQKLTPMFLTKDGKIWKALCIVSLSSEKEAGHIKIYRMGSNQIHTYDLTRNFWKLDEKAKLSDRESEILQLSTRGYTIKEIAEALFISEDTVKFHKRNLCQKLDVSNISEAIAFATNNKLV
ncbi:helix-turn-helix transcriptional regulator [Parapedobacter sp. 10938]|uniref:helix-turn-helix transcriptional regulator n=1 Tax=Parapedobacter flavus TaxID=3110225 RepID=UPI002DB656FF|nr:LuxR C-terminal-related transcriptional regulator [Parapedobacter sp. 10938]MEC3881173.1 LuxR C-terminal-related transcriptional regulator [Parapedobacter sp. 10938]